MGGAEGCDWHLRRFLLIEYVAVYFSKIWFELGLFKLQANVYCCSTITTIQPGFTISSSEIVVEVR